MPKLGLTSFLSLSRTQKTVGPKILEIWDTLLDTFSFLFSFSVLTKVFLAECKASSLEELLDSRSSRCLLVSPNRFVKWRSSRSRRWRFSSCQMCTIFQIEINMNLWIALRKSCLNLSWITWFYLVGNADVTDRNFGFQFSQLLLWTGELLFGFRQVSLKLVILFDQLIDFLL